jgi:hypothetical protein
MRRHSYEPGKFDRKSCTKPSLAIRPSPGSIEIDPASRSELKTKRLKLNYPLMTRD